MEVLISLGIMSIALVSLVAVLTTGLRANYQSTARGDAQDFALQVLGRTLSELEDLPDKKAHEFWTTDISSTPWEEGTEKRNGTAYKFEVRVYDMAGASGSEELAGDRNQLKKITIKVDWNDSKGDSTLTIGRLVNREI